MVLFITYWTNVLHSLKAFNWGEWQKRSLWLVQKLTSTDISFRRLKLHKASEQSKMDFTMLVKTVASWGQTNKKRLSRKKKLFWYIKTLAYPYWQCLVFISKQQTVVPMYYYCIIFRWALSTRKWFWAYPRLIYLSLNHHFCISLSQDRYFASPSRIIFQSGSQSE